jgi:hypothetical protein
MDYTIPPLSYFLPNDYSGGYIFFESSIWNEQSSNGYNKFLVNILSL